MSRTSRAARTSILARILATLAAAMLAATSIAQAVPVGEFENHADIGGAALHGDATYNAASQEYLLTAAGAAGPRGAHDEFHFAWRKLPGDFILQARVEFPGKSADSHRKAGWTVRRSLDADSPHVEVTVQGDELADVIQLERRGSRYFISTARYGDAYTTREIAAPDVGAEPCVGLFLSARNPEIPARAIFRDVRIIRPARADFVPYRDYIGSVLELLNIETGHREIIHAARVPFEAPNWTRDGTALIFNSSGNDPQTRGRLYRFDLATHRLSLIDTDFAIRNNNDHVLSFDGAMLGISDQSTDANQSTVFTLPAGGGVPKRITPLTPSYLHGWSPDAKWLIYTGGRNGDFDIYKAPADGSGKEIRLTTAAALDDGPEFTPDGRSIYFNSTRSGKMQIWRMKADGSDQERVTNDEYNNWFPHLSPDGRWIAMISYVDEVAPAEHPYYKRVYLRLMPVAGGAAKVVAYVYGGQGTMNVPSWSPDGRMLAFVSNSDRRIAGFE